MKRNIMDKLSILDIIFPVGTNYSNLSMRHSKIRGHVPKCFLGPYGFQSRSHTIQSMLRERDHVLLVDEFENNL